MHAPTDLDERGKGTLAFRFVRCHAGYTSSGNRHWGGEWMDKWHRDESRYRSQTASGPPDESIGL